MKKLLSLLVMLICLSSLTVSAQEVLQLTVADGTAESSVVPVYGPYADFYTRDQTIYPASMISNMEGSVVSGIRFYMSSIPDNLWSTIYSVKLSTTENTSFTTNEYLTTNSTTVYTGLITPANDGTVSLAFTTPFNYYGGNLLLEIVTSNPANSYGTGYFYGINSAGGSLYGYGYGPNSVYPYVSDFIPKTTFAYSAASSCLSPDNLTLSNITTGSAGFSWHPRASGTSYYAVAPYGTNPNDLTWTSTTDTFCTLNGLSSGAHYTAYVRTDCGDEFSYTQTISFYTLCGVVNTFPFFEGFEDSWVPTTLFDQVNPSPLCWSVYNGGNTASSDPYSTPEYHWMPNQNDYQVYEGSHSAICHTDYGIGPHNDWLISPMMNFQSNMQISFWAQNSTSASNEQDEISVWISDENLTLTAPAATAYNTLPLPGFTQIFQTQIPVGPFTLYEIPVSGYPGNRYIAFVRRNAPYDGWNLCLDNVTVEELPGCLRPTNLTTVSVGTTSAVLSWNSDATHYILYYKPTEASSYTSVTGVTLNSNGQYVLNGLDPGYAYEWYVAAVCADSTVIPAVYIQNFTTECAPINALPYIVDFESNIIGAGGDLPSCWSKPMGGAYPITSPITEFAHSGHNSLISSSASSLLAVLPELASSIAINSLQLSFWAKCYYGTNCMIEVGAMTDPGNPMTFTTLHTINSLTDEYQEFIVNLSSYQGNAHHLALRLTCGLYQSSVPYPDNLMIDDLTLSLLASCPRSENVTVENVTSTSATLSWSSQGSAFKVYYKQLGTANFVAATSTAITDTTYVVQNLTPGTDYSFYVASICADETEAISTTTTAKTLCAGITTLPYFCGFEENLVGSDGALLPECWTRGSNNIAHPFVSSYDVYAGGHGLFSFYDNTVALPPIDTSVIPISGLQISFIAKTSSYNSGPVQVGVMSNPADPSTFVQVGDNITLTPSYAQYDVSLASYSGNGGIIAFRTLGYVDTYIDNVMLDLLPACSRPIITNVLATNNQATVTWTSDSGTVAWQVVIGSVGVDPSMLTPVNVFNTTYTFTNLTPNADYVIYVRTNCGGQYSDWSNPYTFYTLPYAPGTVPYSCYFENNAENNKWSLINGSLPNQWVIGTATNHTPGGSRSLYISQDNGVTNSYNLSNYVCVWAYRDILLGDAPEYELSFDWRCLGEDGLFNNVDYMTVYIGAPMSVNADNSYNTPSELTYLGEFVADSAWSTVHFTLDGALYGNSVQRIYFNWQNDDHYGSGIAAAVDNVTVMEVECARPVSVEMTTIGVNTATLTITPASANDSLWEVSIDDSLFVTSSTVVNLTGLTSSTSYSIMVRTICSANNNSVWTVPVVFTTECMLISSVPQTWDFESNNTAGTPDYPLQECWRRITNPASLYDQYPYVYNFSAHSGARSMYFYAYYNNCYAIMPAIDPSTLNLHNLQLSFYASKEGTGNLSMTVGVMTDPNDIATFTPVQTVNLGDGFPADPYMVNFASYTGTGIYIAIRNNTIGQSYASIYLDDVTLDYVPDCPYPTAVAVNDVTQTTATVSWTSAPSVTAWNIKVNNGTSETTIPVTTNPYTLTNLTAGTPYSVSVQSVCSADNQSEWSNAFSFSTICDVYNTFPYTQGFENGGEMPDCWTQEYANGTVDWEFQAGACEYGNINTAHSGDYNALLYYPASNGGYKTKLISPLFDLTNVTSPYMTFWHAQQPWFQDQDELTVYYRTSVTGQWQQLAHYNNPIDYWAFDSLTLPNPSATYQIAFEGMTDYGYGVIIDDITIGGTNSGPVTNNPTVTTDAVTGVTQTTATLNGTITNPNNTPITLKGFEWKLASQSEYNAPVVVLSDVLTFELTGLSPATDYTYRAFIVFNGTTSFADPVNFTTLEPGVEPCEAPTGLHTTHVESESVSIAWDYKPGVQSWNIQYRYVGQSDYTSASSSTNSYTIHGLYSNTTYEIQVQANCDNEELSDWSNFITVTTEDVGIDNWLENSVVLFPNPAREYIDIRIDGNVNASSMEVYDVYGKLISNVNVVENPTRINVSSLANGMYFVRVTTEAGTVTKSFVKN